MNPLVSIIIPMYNAEKYIKETIYSVLNQTYSNWEIIIVDNYSTDNSRQIVKEFLDNRIMLITLDYNSGGPARPRNIGLENAKGEYIAFLDADDVWHERKLQVQISEIINNNLNFTSTNSINIDKNGIDINNQYKVWNFIKKFKSKATLCDVIKGNFIATSSVVVLKDLISSFDESKDFIAVEDLCLWMEILNNKNTKYKYIPEKLLKYRVLLTTISERGKNQKQATRAKLCVLTFILKHNRFDYLPCFYYNIVLTVFVNIIKKLLRK